MQKLLPLVWLSCLLGCAPAQAEPCLPLQPRGTQGGALMPGGLMNVRFGGTARTPLALDVYPHADSAMRPLAVVLRGGRGTVGERSSYVGQLVELFADAGYVVATADYRAVPDGVDDLTAALRLLTMCHAAALHVDQYKVVLVAEDSAAVPAASVSARLRELRLGRFGGAPAPPVATVLIGARTTAMPPLTQPTVIVHGSADTEVPIAGIRTLCATAGPSCQVVEVEDASHRVENWWPSQWGYKSRLLAALAPLVGPIQPPAWPSTASLRKKVTFDAAHGLTLDLRVPPGAGPHPAVVLVHGGGWEAGDRVTYVAPIFDLAAARGLASVSVDYRLTPSVSNREQVEDVAAALRFLRDQAASLRLDPRRLVLVGESASGQIVAHLASTERDLAGVISFYGVYDLEAMAGDPSSPRSLARRLFGITQLDDSARRQLRAFSPLHHASKELPPLLLIAGTADRLVVQQRAYVTALEAAGARVESIEIEGAPHGMEAWHEEPRWRRWKQQVGDWIVKRMAK